MSETVDRLKRRERVIAANDLPGVPAGTPGRVLEEVGLTWYRYFVAFDNGVELSTIDRSDLRRPGERE